MSDWQDLGFVWRAFVRSWQARWKCWLPVVLGLMLLSGLVLFPNDLRWLRAVQGSGALEGLEEGLGFWGDFLQFNVTWAIVLFVAGTVRKNRWWRRAAIAFLLAGVLSGVTTRPVKMTTGRARPYRVEAHALHWISFTGPTTSPKYHSYFSGHTSATFASAVALVLVLPRVGWIALVFAAAVGWSRMYGNHHFPSDVLHGALWGTMWGGLVGRGLAGDGRLEQKGAEEGRITGAS